MILKEILKLFFRYNVVEIPVMEQSGSDLLGIIRKERIVELNNSHSDLNQTFESSIDQIIQRTDDIDPATIFNAGCMDQIPILDRSGQITKFDSKPNIIFMLHRKPAVIAPAPDFMKQSTLRAGIQETNPDDMSMLENILVPILVTNTSKVILFANQFFFHRFDMQKDFVIRQKLDATLVKLKIENSMEGTFTYAHTKWNYKVNYVVDRIFIVFTEVKESVQNSAFLDAEKLLKGKAGMKDLIETYENGLIKKVLQRTKGNTKQAAQFLGLDEKSLGYRMGKIR